MNMTEETKPICPTGQRSCCPLSSTLDIVGDKWTLLVLRDMLVFKKQVFGEFLESPEGISTNILTDRLKKLEGFGLITKNAYQQKPVRYQYQLTDLGLTLRPLMFEMSRWGREHLANTKTLPPDKQAAYTEPTG